ncbi:MAG: 16S rRNA (cytosine(1402)-N(4))-methyltransferase RsmH [Puniceicoccales bacterium]|jgi:16S rRNA (cytosine1402-N4)-methyltransferase|nr:16S rRNA (cytosine(1402)-N(4))-methyltransferase RsmH [Puniceicoccales bacterium]
MPGHRPVLLHETLALLRAAAGGVFWDGTFGGGGHTRGILEASPAGTVYAVDRDPAAAARAAALESEFPGRLHFTHANHADTKAFAGQPFDGALIDAGVSSFQLDDATRGFSFRADAPSDMRMDPGCGIPAAEFLETAPEASLVEAVRDFGGEPRWRAVVRALLAARGTGALARTESLAALVARAVHRPGPPPRIHPCTLVFQGIRIAVNNELGSLRAVLPAVFAALKPGGVLAVISFHSLEDRIAKHYFNEIAGRPVGRDDNRPQDSRTAVASLLTRHPVQPSEAERTGNPRSRSARLRAVCKLPAPAAPPAIHARIRT